MPATLQKFLTVEQTGSGHPRLVPWIGSVAVACNKGDLCVIDSNGRLKPAIAQATGADVYAGASPSTTTRLCILDQPVPANLAQDTLVQAYFVDDDTVLKMLILSDAAPTAALTNGYPWQPNTAGGSAFTYRGKQYSLWRCAAAPYPYVVDTNLTTYVGVEVIDWDPQTATDTWFAVLVRPVPNAWLH